MKTILGGFESQDDLMHMFGSFFAKFKRTDEHIIKDLECNNTENKSQPKEDLSEEPTLFI